MSFWSDLFSKKKRADDTGSMDKQSSSNDKNSFASNDDWNYQEFQFDEHNCLTYPNGIKLYYVEFKSYADILPLVTRLGYNDGEVFHTYHNSKGEVITSSFDATIWVVWELITNKLVCIITRNKVVLEKSEMERIISNVHEKWSTNNYDGLENGTHLLTYLGNAVTGNADISLHFIERVLNKQCYDNVIDVGKYHFLFKDDMLCHCMYNGYDVSMFSINYPLGIGLREIDDYFKYANNSHYEESTMKKIINYQARCFSHIDKEILSSEISKEKFAYDEYGYSINYIAMAAFYKQCDVEKDLFVLSTDGRYEIVSKTNKNGVTITKVRAYHEVFTFTNDHSMPEQLFDIDQKTENSADGLLSENSGQGYVYVMINPSLPDLVKIGMTTKDPNERAKELSAATGVPTPFILVFYKPFADCFATEQRIHQFLEGKGYRVNNNREFFNMPTNVAIDVVQAYYNLEQEELGQ